MRAHRLWRQIQVAASHFVRRLSWPRHSHGNYVERCRCHGRRSFAHSRQRNVSSTTNERTFGRDRDHETKEYHYFAEQN